MAEFIPALSVMQPWAHLIIHRFKSIENRSRRCHYRGQILIHAGLKVDESADISMLRGWHPVADREDPALSKAYRAAGQAGEIHRGGIVGIAEVVDCIDTSDDPYFVGPFGWVLANARPLRFQRCRGMLGFFDPKIEVDLSEVAAP